MGSSCRSIVSTGPDGLVVDIECHLSNNLPTMVIVGHAGKTVHEARDRLRGAFSSSALSMPRRRITINLAPADVPKAETGLDAAIAVSILAANEQITNLDAGQAVVGELGLDGSARPVRGIIGKLQAGRRVGILRYYIPLANLSQAQLIPGLALYPYSHLRELYEHLSGQTVINPVNTGDGIHQPTTTPTERPTVLDDIAGQTAAKRALVIAAAGGHNILLSGPPGTGKSMLARALPSLLPPLSHEETLEVTHLHSLVNRNYEELAINRPIRAPHHSASHTAMIGGGGPNMRPGEISLSHRGVLLLDEFPEFNRSTLEALRQPLEDRVITVVRTKDSVQYAADFLLVATANPCPCGYLGSKHGTCSCLPSALARYAGKLSGPLLDRIDLCCTVTDVQHTALLSTTSSAKSSIDWPQVVARVRRTQQQRYGSTVLNGSASNHQLREQAQLDSSATSLLNTAAERLALSARAYIRVSRVARTIADLEESRAVSAAHMSEALSYRQRPATAGVDL